MKLSLPHRAIGNNHSPASRRRHQRAYRIRREWVKGLWIIGGTLMLLSDQLAWVLAGSLFLTCLSFMILDESNDVDT